MFDVGDKVRLKKNWTKDSYQSNASLQRIWFLGQSEFTVVSRSGKFIELKGFDETASYLAERFDLCTYEVESWCID